MFNLQVTVLLGFLINFASGLLWQISGHPIILVAQESKLCSGESKTSKILTNFDYCKCSSCRAQFLSDLLYPPEASGGYFGLAFATPPPRVERFRR